MKKWLMRGILGLGLLLSMVATARAQTITTVSGTVVDPNGNPWSGATLTISISATATPTITPCITAPSCPVIMPPAITLSPTGAFTQALVANGSILPVSSTYTFCLSFPGQLFPLVPFPIGTGPQSFCSTGNTISGASQSLSATLSALAPAILSTNAAGSPQKSAATNFGTAIGTAQTIVASAAAAVPYTISFYTWQSLAGASCGAGTNTATVTLAWTGPGGSSETLALTALSISANGALDSNQTQTVTITPSVGTAITYTVASTLASTGCSPVPQYTVQARAIP
jgi:hypothetical protein